MIPFVLGFIGGFAFAVLLLSLYAVMRASSMRSREEEEMNETIRRTMQGLQDKEARMSQTLRELHTLEAEAVKREKRSESREDVE